MLQFEEPNGESPEKAIVVIANKTLEGISQEYKWIGSKYPMYKRKGQRLEFHGDKKYDVILFDTAEGEPKEIYFDVTQFFGKPLF